MEGEQFLRPTSKIAAANARCSSSVHGKGFNFLFGAWPSVLMGRALSESLAHMLGGSLPSMFDVGEMLGAGDLVELVGSELSSNSEEL